MKIKIDEDLPKAVAESIRSVVPDTLTVMEEGLCGVLDPVLWETAQKEGGFLITGDKAFANIRQYPPGTTPASCCSGPMSTVSTRCAVLYKMS